MDHFEIFFNKLRENERARTCGAEAVQRYQKIHARRFQRTIEICKQLAPNPHIHVLDIGPSSLTNFLSREYDHVSTLGLDPAEDEGGQNEPSLLDLHLPHISFELNNSPYPDRWPSVRQTFDLIVFAETMEHLSIAPEYSLVFLASLLSEHGILLVTTPNAATIMKRFILLLKGKNPYEPIRLFSENPGHFREYTMREMIGLASICQFDVLFMKYINFYSAASILQTLLKNLYPGFRDSLVMAYRKQWQLAPTIQPKG